MKKLTLLSITLLTAGNGVAMDIAQQAQPLTPRTTRIMKALKEYNDPAHRVVLESVPKPGSNEEQIKILCDRHISSAITADKFAASHNKLKDGTPIASEEERLLPKLQDSAADQTKKTFLAHMREATAAHYKTEIGKATQARNGYIASAAAIINKLQDKLVLTSDKDRLNRDHVDAQNEMLKYNAQIMALTEQAFNADAEYEQLRTPGIKLGE